jgi:hypothetical protein
MDSAVNVVVVCIGECHKQIHFVIAEKAARQNLNINSRNWL